MKETLDYYKLLVVAEIEGDLVKAMVAKNSKKVEGYYNKLIKAKLNLIQTEAKQIS